MLNMLYECKTTRRVEFVDTDMAGIVHFSNYFRFMESVEHAFWLSLNLAFHMQIEGQTMAFPRVHAECDYHEPLRFGDEVELHLLIREIRNKSMVFDVIFTRMGSIPKVVGRGSITTVCVKQAADGSLKSTLIPDVIRDKIQVAPAELLARTASTFNKGIS